MKVTMIRTEVTYTREHAGKFYMVEHVPARVCKEKGEQFFAPETVERRQERGALREGDDDTVVEERASTAAASFFLRGNDSSTMIR